MQKVYQIKQNMGLTVEDTIPLWTPAGTYEIQLLYGDITRLSVEDMVDIIMVSAFPGDYAAIPGTVLSALNRNLGIDTLSLAYSKELDLRQQFFCWISKPLANSYPYRRLLCFERSRQANSSLVSQIRDMFRVFVPVFNNRETTVITPLLATGNQGHSRTKVLATMLECAASWIQAGLPLKCLKIVIYGLDTDPGLNDVFNKAKSKYMAISQKQEYKLRSDVLWDVLITYEPDDKPWATKIEGTLKSKKSDIKVYTAHQDIDESKVWQDQIFKLMLSSLRIIVVLTPSFIGNRDCLEQYNMAMCCGRMRNSNILLPFYVVASETMPVYMSLVQYYDCRIRKENDEVEIKIQEACTILVNHLHEEKRSIMDGDKSASVLDKKKEIKFDYDVFISYSHKNPQEAQTVLKILSEKNPDLKIFFDREELKMGSMWQKSLYHSLDTVKCVIALMSPTYLSSMVCQEEYNIALLRQLTSPDEILFIPVNISDLDNIPQGFGELKMLDARGDNFDSAITKVTDTVLDWLKSGNKTEFHNSASEVAFNNDVFENYRTLFLPEIYELNRRDFEIMRTDKPKLPKTNVGLSVALCFAGESMYCPVMFQRIIENSVPTIDIHLVWIQNARSHHDLDSSAQIVVFLSRQFLETEECMQNLHMALCRQRSAKGKRILHIVQTDDLPNAPQFVKLLDTGVCFKDDIWSKYQKKINPHDMERSRKTVLSKRREISGTFSCKLSDYFAITKIVDDVLDAFHTNKDCEEKPAPNLMNVIQLQKHLDGRGKEPVEIRFIENLPDKKEETSLSTYAAEDKEESHNTAHIKKAKEDMEKTDQLNQLLNKKKSSACDIL